MVSSNFSNLSIEHMDSMLTCIKGKYAERFSLWEKKRIMESVFESCKKVSPVNKFSVWESEICICEIQFEYPAHGKLGRKLLNRLFKGQHSVKWERILLMTSDQMLRITDAHRTFSQDYPSFEVIYEEHFPNITRDEFERLISGSDLVLREILVQMSQIYDVKY